MRSGGEAAAREATSLAGKSLYMCVASMTRDYSGERSPIRCSASREGAEAARDAQCGGMERLYRGVGERLRQRDSTA